MKVILPHAYKIHDQHHITIQYTEKQDMIEKSLSPGDNKSEMAIIIIKVRGKVAKSLTQVLFESVLLALV